MTGLADHLHKLYDHTCSDDCKHPLITLADNKIDSIFDDLAKQIHDGNFTEGIPNELYFEIAQNLATAITEGLGEGFEYDDPLNALAAELKANLYQFSGAKTVTEVTAMRDLLLDTEDKIKSFSQYRQDVEAQVNKLYNEQYLSAEYNNAVGQGQMAVKWQDFKALGKDTWLEYRTAHDDRVRASHAVLDGIVEKIDSAFWAANYPPNDWGCRCNVIPADKPEVKLADNISSKEAVKLGKENVNPLFQNNAAVSGVIFKKDHPYFASLKGIKLSAAAYGLQPIKTNFGDAAAVTKTATDYYIWWNKFTKDGKKPFVVKDAAGANILFDDTIKKNAEKLYEYATNIQNIVSNANEVWYNNGQWNYIKYFFETPMMVTVAKDNDILLAKTFSTSVKNISNMRKGVLLLNNE